MSQRRGLAHLGGLVILDIDLVDDSFRKDDGICRRFRGIMRVLVGVKSPIAKTAQR